MTDLETPSDKLALSTVKRLREAGLLRGERETALLAKIASGRMTADDWKLELELAEMKAEGE